MSEIADARIAPPPLRRRRRSRRPCRARGWLRLSPMNQRRLANFRANRRGYWSFWIFLVLFVLSLFAEFIANDRPILVRYKGELLFAGLRRTIRRRSSAASSPQTDYRDPVIAKEIEENGWVIWPPIRFAYRTPSTSTCRRAAPSPPTWMLAGRACASRSRRSAGFANGACRDLEWNWLGTDDQGPRRAGARDLRLPHLGAVRADPRRHLLGHRHRSPARCRAISAAGSTCIFQRFIEIWSAIPLALPADHRLDRSSRRAS